MKKTSTFFLKFVLILLAVVVFTWLIWFPQTEGRAIHMDLIRIYADPLIVYLHISSMPFFFGLYQAFILLNLIDANKAFSQAAVNTLKNMKYASICLIGLIVLAELYIHIIVHVDDPAGPTMLGVMICFVISVIGTACALFERLFQNAVDIKSENDLTV